MPQPMPFPDIEQDPRVGVYEHVDVRLKLVRDHLQHCAVDHHEASVPEHRQTRHRAKANTPVASPPSSGGTSSHHRSGKLPQNCPFDAPHGLIAAARMTIPNE